MSGAAYEYGTCHVCGGPMKESRVEQAYRAKDRWVVINSVPLGVCTACGARVARSDVTKRIEELIKSGRGTPVEILSVDWPAA
jgi:YgiT-type zinc finger domain-containing protein